VPHQEIDCKFEYFSEFEFIFETALGYESVGWGTCFNEKTRGKISRVSVPLKFITKNKNDEIKKDFKHRFGCYHFCSISLL
jgi:hypothetical protein